MERGRSSNRAMFSLENKSAVITGAGSGIGRAIAQTFSKQGAKVYVLDLDLNNAQETVELTRGRFDQAFAYACDVSKQQAVCQVFGEISRIDILVNCAGIAHIGKAHTTNEEDFDRVYRVNVKGTYNCLHEVIPIFAAQNHGVILNVASIASHVGLPDRFAYSMSKGAVFSMTLSVAKDYLQNNIRCNSISPARVHTPFVDRFIAETYPGKEMEMFEKLSKSQPIGRMANVEEVSALALFLCSDESKFITGNDYPIDGGFIKLSN